MQRIKNNSQYSFSANKTLHPTDTKKQLSKNIAISTVATVTGGCAGAALFNVAVKDRFTSEKNDIIKKHSDFIEAAIKKSINKRIEIDGRISEEEIKDIRTFKLDKFKRKLDTSLIKVNIASKKLFRKYVSIGLLSGLVIGVSSLVIADNKKVN